MTLRKTIATGAFFILLSNLSSAASYQKLTMLDAPVVNASAAISKKPVTKKKKRNKWSSCLWNAKAVKRKASKHETIITAAAKKYAVNSNLIKAVIAVESCYNIKAVSPAGAQGLMQLIPDTADRFGVTDSFDPKQNINAGAKYLRFLLDRFDGDVEKAAAGYNAGEGKVDRYNGIPPYKETRNYVKNVVRIFKALSFTEPSITDLTVKKKQQTPKSSQRRIVNHKPRARQVIKKSKPKRVHVVYKPKAMFAKPGRQGWEYNRHRAPHLFKKQKKMVSLKR